MRNIKVLQDKLEEIEKAIHQATIEASNDERTLEQKERDSELAKHLQADIDAKLAELAELQK
jgi:hypothetical protein